MRTHYTLSIDPGISGTGFALWSQRKTPGRAQLHSSGSLTGAAAEDWIDVGADICTQLPDRLAFKPDEVLFELPASWGGAAAVSTRSGAVVKLAVMAGMLCGTLQKQFGCKLVPIPVNTWKGQLPKELCNERIRRIMNWKPGKTTHELDAVGIGLWYFGEFK